MQTRSWLSTEGLNASLYYLSKEARSTRLTRLFIYFKKIYVLVYLFLFFVFLCFFVFMFSSLFVFLCLYDFCFCVFCVFMFFVLMFSFTSLASRACGGLLLSRASFGPMSPQTQLVEGFFLSSFG